MTDYSHIERDFIQRTQTIIEQYEQHVQTAVSADEAFEVTLLLNCLLGLLVFPQQLAAQNHAGRGWSRWLTEDKVVHVGSKGGARRYAG